MLLLLAGLSTAQAAEPKGTVMLACEGTATNSLSPADQPPAPASKVVIFNFDAKTIEVGDPGKYSITTRDGSDFRVLFDGTSVDDKSSLWGAINRVTGDLEFTLVFPKERDRVYVEFSLKCKPAQRMF
jgi:hypothetical protein